MTRLPGVSYIFFGVLTRHSADVGLHVPNMTMKIFVCLVVTSNLFVLTPFRLYVVHHNSSARGLG